LSKSKKVPKGSVRKTKNVPRGTPKFNAMDLFRAQDATSKAVVRRMVNDASKTTDGFDNFVSRLGLNNDNALSGGTYAFNLITRNRILLEAAYRGSWVVGAVIDSVAEDMTRAGIDVITGEKVDLDILDKNMVRLQIWQSVQSLIKWGRLYGGAIGIMQIEGQDLSTPLNVETVAQKQFKGIVVFDRWMLAPVLTPVIESGPEMGLPAYYQLVTYPTLYDPEAAPATGMIKVHHSRVIRYTGIDLPFFQAITEMMWGESILERLWDRLISFDNATLSSASLIDRANLRTVGVNGLREVVAAGGEARDGLLAQFEMMRLMQVNEGLTLMDKEDTFQSTAYSFAGLSDMMLQFGQQLAGASGIPLVRLFGQSPAGLNSTGDADIRMYYDNIKAQQEAKLRNPFESLLKVMWRSTYGTPSPADLEFSFTPLWQMSALDKSVIAKSNTETTLGAFDAGLIPQKTAMKELQAISKETGLFCYVTDEDVEQADEELPPMPDENADPVIEQKPSALPEEVEKPKTKDSPNSKILQWLLRK
jgi:phage-related protein (TIGR01555 family)